MFPGYFRTGGSARERGCYRPGEFPGKASGILFPMVDGLVPFETYTPHKAGSLYKEL